MAYLNVISLQQVGAPDTSILAALIGGDLEPRLLPTGSLAGLLWLEALRRDGVEVKLRTFVALGVAVTVPCLTAALLVFR